MDIYGHVSVFYEERGELFSILADYFREGLMKHELCILVTANTKREIISHMRTHGLFIKEPLQKGDLRIFEMEQTYLPNNKFTTDFMIGNVASFIEDARSLGYDGLRTAGEMSWLTGRSEFTQEVTAYEMAVNDLTDAHSSFTGICLYPLNSDDSLASQPLKTHPSYFQDGELSLSPDYEAKPA